MEIDKLRTIAKEYLKSRETFLKEASLFPELDGNDNIVGRIGEFIAIQFLRSQNRIVVKAVNKVQKGYDLTTQDGHKVSVKLITSENKKGRTTKIKPPWTELIVISLNNKYTVDRLGYIKYDDFKKAISKEAIKEEPYADRKLLTDNNLFDTYGKLYKDKDVINYL